MRQRLPWQVRRMRLALLGPVLESSSGGVGLPCVAGHPERQLLLLRHLLLLLLRLRLRLRLRHGERLV